MPACVGATMSKTLGTILAVAAAAALVASGVGAAVGLAAFGTTVGVTVANISLGTLLTASTVLAAGASLLGGGIRAQKPETTEVAIRVPRPPRVRAYGTSRLYGASICYETVNGQTVDVWAFHDGRASAIIQPYLNDDKVTVSGGFVQRLPDKRYQSNTVQAGWSLGLPNETAFAAVTAIMPEWTPDHRGDGVVCGYLTKKPEKDKYFLETYPQGDSVTLSLVGQWAPVFDPRDPTQNAYDPSTWKFSENAVLAFIHYLMTERGKDWNSVFLPKLPMILEAINDAGSQRQLATGGSEMKYRTALSYKATDAPAAVVGSLLACFDGWYTFNEEGHLILYSGKVYAPTVTIGPDQIVAFSHQAGVADENFINEIGVTYVSDLHDWNTVEAQSWRDEEDISTRGAIRSDDLGAVVPSYRQGRFLAKRKMARANAPDRGRVSTNFSGRVVAGQRYIRLNLTEGGATFFNGIAEVMDLERDEMTGGFTFDWVAVDPNLDAWNPATEDGEGAPVGNRYTAPPLAPPVISSDASVAQESTGDGTVVGTGARILVTMAGSHDTDLTWYVRWRVGSGAWNEQRYDDADAGTGVELLTGFVPINTTVSVQAEYRTVGGQLSDWSDTVNVETTGSATDPAPIASAIISTSKPSDALTISASTDPAGSTISVSAHSRIYSDRTVEVDAGQFGGLTASTTYSIYYDDPERAGGLVSYAGAESADDAVPSAAHPYRHYVGYVTTPAAGQPPSGGGGAIGPGGAGGGERNDGAPQ